MKTHLLFFLFCFSCSSRPLRPVAVNDKTLGKNEAPAFLREAVPKGSHIDDVEFFLKTKRKQKTYEVKFEENENEVSLHFDDQGRLFEKERDVDFDSLTNTQQEKIRHYLSKRFAKYKIQETEIRDEKLIDVEVSHQEKPTGLSEISFTLEGDYVSEEVEDAPQIETLN